MLAASMETPYGNIPEDFDQTNRQSAETEHTNSLELIIQTATNNPCHGRGVPTANWPTQAR